MNTKYSYETLMVDPILVKPLDPNGGWADGKVFFRYKVLSIRVPPTRNEWANLFENILVRIKHKNGNRSMPMILLRLYCLWKPLLSLVRHPISWTLRQGYWIHPNEYASKKCLETYRWMRKKKKAFKGLHIIYGKCVCVMSI